MFEEVCAKDAGVNLQDWRGQTPLLLAKQIGHNGIVELLRKHGAKE
ncbi:hypothetical protein ES703_26914 [subsurface metagenome]